MFLLFFLQVTPSCSSSVWMTETLSMKSARCSPRSELPKRSYSNWNIPREFRLWSAGIKRTWRRREPWAARRWRRRSVRTSPSSRRRPKTAPGWKLRSGPSPLLGDCLLRRARPGTSSSPSSPTSPCASASGAGERGGRGGSARPAPPRTLWRAGRASPATCGWCWDPASNTNPRGVRFNESRAFSQTNCSSMLQCLIM